MKFKLLSVILCILLITTGCGASAKETDQQFEPTTMVDANNEALLFTDELISISFEHKGNTDYDVDASVFLLDEENVAQEDDFVFYNSLEHYSGAVSHFGDNADDNGDKEEIWIDFEDLPEYAEKVALAITIHEAKGLKQNFGKVPNAKVTVKNEVTKKNIVEYDLSNDFYYAKGLVLTEFVRTEDGWNMITVGQNFEDGLASICTHFGLEVE